MEKNFAQKAGIGWQGKHTNVLSKKLGNWIFLGLIFTNIKFEVDIPEKIIVENVVDVLKFVQQMLSLLLTN